MWESPRKDASGQIFSTYPAMDCGRASTEACGEVFPNYHTMDRRRARTHACDQVISMYRAMDHGSVGGLSPVARCVWIEP